jgi:hypothetical protein
MIIPRTSLIDISSSYPAGRHSYPTATSGSGTARPDGRPPPTTVWPGSTFVQRFGSGLKCHVVLLLCAPRGGAEDLTAAVRSALPGRSLSPQQSDGFGANFAAGSSRARFALVEAAIGTDSRDSPK